MQKKPLIAIVGPNGAGKTALSIALAKKFNGEVVSADSRQVYSGMDIGSGKASQHEQRQAPHHLLDVASPKRQYTIAHFKRDAVKTIGEIHSRNHIPFLVGGTAFWVDAVVYDLDIPHVKPDAKLRARLKGETPARLHAMLRKLDPQRAKAIDPHNPYRLIRAIEIVQATGKPVPKLGRHSPYRTLMLGITHPRAILYRRIDERLAKRFKQGMIAEVRNLHEHGVSWKRLHALGLEYRYISLFLQGKLLRDEMAGQLKVAIKHFAKRQMTWLQRDKHIRWVKSQEEATQLVKRFLG
ncbi:MAG: tRNA (adenosine(37)-N6)-dimethylallyltransferase MiaA [Patescibacteria group bacterium]